MVCDAKECKQIRYVYVSFLEIWFLYLKNAMTVDDFIFFFKAKGDFVYFGNK